MFFIFSNFYIKYQVLLGLRFGKLKVSWRKEVPTCMGHVDVEGGEGSP
jgi:hypothetical protein